MGSASALIGSFGENGSGLIPKTVVRQSGRYWESCCSGPKPPSEKKRSPQFFSRRAASCCSASCRIRAAVAAHASDLVHRARLALRRHRLVGEARRRRRGERHQVQQIVRPQVAIDDRDGDLLRGRQRSAAHRSRRVHEHDEVTRRRSRLSRARLARRAAAAARAASRRTTSGSSPRAGIRCGGRWRERVRSCARTPRARSARARPARTRSAGTPSITTASKSSIGSDGPSADGSFRTAWIAPAGNAAVHRSSPIASTRGARSTWVKSRRRSTLPRASTATSTNCRPGWAKTTGVRNCAH